MSKFNVSDILCILNRKTNPIAFCSTGIVEKLYKCTWNPKSSVMERPFFLEHDESNWLLYPGYYLEAYPSHLNVQETLCQSISIRPTILQEIIIDRNAIIKEIFNRRILFFTGKINIIPRNKLTRSYILASISMAQKTGL